MPSPLEKDFARVQAGDVPGWCEGLPLDGISEMDPDGNMGRGSILMKFGTDIAHLETRHAWSMIRWLWGQGWTIEPPMVHDKRWCVSSTGKHEGGLAATTDYEATHEACERCEAEMKENKDGD